MKKKTLRLFLLCVLVACEMTGCTHRGAINLNTDPGDPPYNDFDQSRGITQSAMQGAVTGAAVGAVVSPATMAAGALIGGAVNGTRSAIDTATKTSPQALMALLKNEDVEVVQEGKLVTLIIPTDKYYQYNSYELNELQFVGLNHIAQLVLRDSKGIIYVAGFSDSFSSGSMRSVAARQHFSEERAQSMADFLWANGIAVHRLVVKGYGEQYDIADNYLIHGAAMNRRVEVQWETQCCPPLSGQLCKD